MSFSIIKYGLVAVVASFVPYVAEAHAFGQQYSLPLPVSLYVRGGVLAFATSCIILAFIDPSHAKAKEKTKSFSSGAWRRLKLSIQSVFMGLFLFGLVSGAFGPDISYENLLTLLFWIGLVLVVPYISIFVDGLWDIGNPFKTAVGWFMKRAEKREPRVWRYSYIPAIVGYVALIAFELFFSDWAVRPSLILCALILYASFLFWGSRRYGKEIWFEFADVFSVFFGLAGMVAPLRLESQKVTFSSPAERLSQNKTPSLWLVVFIIFALAATAFDGFRETALFASLSNGFNLTLFSWGVFVLFPVLFGALYIIALWLAKLVSGGRESLKYYLKRFTFSLVPIMIAYHFAHYFSLLITTLPSFLVLISDPFNLGWNIFHTKAMSQNLLIGSDKIWYVELLVIVSGHIFAAYVGHKIAFREFSTKKQALLSQVPILVLMVLYTAFGLWVLSEPFAI